MAKDGIEGFFLNCQLDEKFELIEAEFGLKGFAILIKLFQRIYGEHGYYCEYNSDISLLLAAKWNITSVTSSGGDAGNQQKAASFGGFASSGGGYNLIDRVVTASIKRGIFDSGMYEKYGILTSHGIQKRYKIAVRKRVNTSMKNEYLLLNDVKNGKTDGRNGKTDGRNGKTDGSFKQSKVKESKVKENNIILRETEALALFEKLWDLYPNKRGKSQIEMQDKLKLVEIGFHEMSLAIERYKKYIDANKDWYRVQNGSTFFKGGYEDYIGDKYEETKVPEKKNGFNHFRQNDYNFEELEKELIHN